MTTVDDEVKFGQIDLEEITYRSGYGHTKLAFSDLVVYPWTVKITSRDGKKKISIQQGFGDLDRFCETFRLAMNGRSSVIRAMRKAPHCVSPIA